MLKLRRLKREQEANDCTEYSNTRSCPHNTDDDRGDSFFLEDDTLLLVVDVGRCVLVAGDGAGVVGIGGVEGGDVGGNRI